MKTVREIITAAHWGGLKVTLEDGIITGSGTAFSAEQENALQTVVAEQVYSPNRVRFPMVRKGFFDGNCNRTLRGRDQWIRLSWTQALDLVHKELMRVRQSYGAQSIFGGSYGWKSSGALHSSRTLLHRYLNLTGGFVNSFSDYSTAAAQQILPYVVGGNEVYEQTSGWETVLENSDIIVLWSANPVTTLCNSWTATDQQGIAYFQRAQQAGKRIICIDPVRSQSCERLKAEWLPIRAGTDVALMLGMAHTLVQEELLERDFLHTHTQGYEVFEAYLLGKNDNQPKTAQWASGICGVPATQIQQLARDFSRRRTILMAGWGMQRQKHGEQPAWMLVVLAAMLGQIGLPGGGFSFSHVNGNGGVARSQAGVLGKISEKSANFPPHFAASIPVSRLTDALLHPCKTIAFNGGQITYPDIKLIYWAGGNPVSQQHDLNLVVQAWQRPECIIVNEINWTPTAKMADIVLPVTTSFERNDLTLSGSFSGQHLFPMKQVIAPQFEAKNDYDIFLELAKRAGVAEQFGEGKSEFDWLRNFYSSLQKCGQNVPSFEAFWQANRPFVFSTEESVKHWVKYADFRRDPQAYPLNTASGKIEIYSEAVAAMGYDDCQGHPMWFEPEEYTKHCDAHYPLTLVTPHSPYRLHSQLAHTSLRQQYALNGREPAWIHPIDAALYGIEHGDMVRIESPRGQVIVAAHVTESVRQGVIALYQGAWYDPSNPGETKNNLCKNGCANVLTSDECSSPLSQGNAPNSCVVRVTKFTGDIPAITAFSPPDTV
ncbi:molybdopterin guanine dinucleotide-containing S/N-oxide reductase [Actinobacillus succinogenes]|nr:molybdopterin guanine dinucleotide-containing S/N-oxide reductase [Actinobacillus succinogenes]